MENNAPDFEQAINEEEQQFLLDEQSRDALDILEEMDNARKTNYFRRRRYNSTAINRPATYKSNSNL